MYRLSGNCFLHNKPMRKGTYEGFVRRLLATYRWLDSRTFKPAPGHLRQIEDLLVAIQYDIIPWVGDGLVLTVSFVSEVVDIRFNLNKLVKKNEKNEKLLESLVSKTKKSCERVCVACGSEAVWDNNKCKEHNQPYRLFADDFRAKRQPKKVWRQPAVNLDTGTTTHQRVLTTVDMFPMDAVEAFHDSAMKSRIGSDNPDRRKLLDAVKEHGGATRQLAIYHDNWAATLEQLRHRFPNFAVLADVLERRIALSLHTGGVVSLPPLLLDGPPGIGKTAVMNWLAEELALPFERLDMSAMQTSGALVGSDQMWSNTQFGVVFKALVHSPLANPFVLLDEVDKVKGSERFDPQNALLGLLEKNSAKHFKDLSAGFEIDASHINWILTSNDAERISAPLLSRMELLSIPAPSVEQMSQIAQSVYAEKLKSHGCVSVFQPQLSESVKQGLSEMSPRELGLCIESAIGRALLSKRDHLVIGDLQRGGLVKVPFGFNLNTVH